MLPVPNEAAINKLLYNFLIGILPSGIKVIRGLVNRVSEPSQNDFIVYFPLSRERLSWNIDGYVDAVFTGDISGTVLNITAVDPGFTGILAPGLAIFGVGIAAGTIVQSNGTGTGGIGTYNINISQTIGSETIAAGTATLMQKTEVVIQCDVHGPNSTDNAQVITTVMRDPVAARYFQPNETGVSPLYADDARQIPFLNGEDQYEVRWIVDVHLQANINVVAAQEFADAIIANVISVDAAYPIT